MAAQIFNNLKKKKPSRAGGWVHILVLDNAHIVQRGTHAELIQQKGLYADFVSARQEAIGWKLAQ